MGAVDIDLEPLISRSSNPLFYDAFDSIAGDTYYNFIAGYLEDKDKTANIWELMNVSIKLVADANVANRFVTVSCYNISRSVKFDTIVSVAITAGQTKYVQIGRYNAFSDMSPRIAGTYYSGIGEGAYQFSGDSYLQLWVQNGLPGDVWEYKMQLKYLNRILNIVPEMYDPKITKWFQGVG